MTILDHLNSSNEHVLIKHEKSENTKTQRSTSKPKTTLIVKNVRRQTGELITNAGFLKILVTKKIEASKIATKRNSPLCVN